MLVQRTWRSSAVAGAGVSATRRGTSRPPPLPPLRAAADQQPGAGMAQQQAQPPARQQQGSSSSDTYEFTYQGSDGRVKATFEQAFKGRVGGASGGAAGEGRAPWAMGYQMSERYSMLWNDDLKARLLKRVAADELGMADEELEARVARLQALLPDLAQKLPSMRPQLVARLAAAVDDLPARLVQLKQVFPGANVALLAMRQPELVLGFDIQGRLAPIAAELRELLPRLNVDLLVTENPSMLDVEGLRAAMAEAARIMPGLDVQAQMGADPQTILGFQRGSQLIPYDPPRPEEEPDDDEYGAYYGSGV